MYLPECPPDHFRIMGIDPGTDTLGIAFIDVHIETLIPRLVYAETNTASKAAKHKVFKIDMRGGRDVRLEYHYDFLYDIMCRAEPLFIAGESPFYQPGRGEAFAALVETYAMLRRVTWDYSPTCSIRRIDPVTAKNYVGVSHSGTDKDDVAKAVYELYKDSCPDGLSIEELDEHSTDAIAVAHTFLRKYVKGDVVVSSKAKKKKGGKRRRKRKKKGG